MEPDPIMKKVYAIKAELAAEVNYDVHKLFERIRKIEEQNKDLLVRPQPREKAASV